MTTPLDEALAEARRLSLPVIVLRTCWDCPHKGQRPAADGWVDVCLRLDVPRCTDFNAPPPSWCPLRSVAP